MANPVKLKSDGVNSGTAVTLFVSEIDVGWQNFTEAPTFVTKNPSSDPVSEVNYLGRENPKISLRGVVDVDNTGSNELTLSLLKSFANETANPVYIEHDIFYPNADTHKVVIDSFTVKAIAQDDVDEQRFEYEIELVEST